MLLECPALADLRDEYRTRTESTVLRVSIGCRVLMARLVWARNQPMVSRYIIACLDRMYADDRQMLFHPFSLVGCQG